MAPIGPAKLPIAAPTTGPTAGFEIGEISLRDCDVSFSDSPGINIYNVLIKVQMYFA
jgi:hypothetical protein